MTLDLPSLWKGRHAVPLNRSMSDLADAARTAKRSPQLADLISPTESDPENGHDYLRVRKSPRRSPKTLQTSHLGTISPDQIQPGGSQSQTNVLWPNPERSSAISESLALVDEGDIRPSTDAVVEDMAFDVTFDDEGLSTLERIFLLSKSDFHFHRAYIARVLGDLLQDVDPLRIG